MAKSPSRPSTHALLQRLEQLFAADENAARFVFDALWIEAIKIIHPDGLVQWSPDWLPDTARAVIQHLSKLRP